MDEMREWQKEADGLAKSAIAAGEPTAWFDQLYSAATAGQVTMPWDRTEPHPILARWADAAGLSGKGREAVVVGCGLGADVAFLASRGFDVTGFDISETAIEIARQRHAGPGIHFVAADLFDLPVEWIHRFDLVAEVFTVQALPDPPRADAIERVGRLVAPGGTLVGIAFRNETEVPVLDGPPWPLRRCELDGFTAEGLEQRHLEPVDDPRWPDATFWLAEYVRSPGG